MPRTFLEIASTPAVLAAQEHYFGRARPFGAPQQRDELTEEEIAFITARDSFYLSSVMENGWPYVQHRGGDPGFLRVVDSHTLAFADYRGNRQMLSTGNIATNDRVALFLMDYPNRERLKILGHAHVDDAREHPELVAQIADSAVRAIVERIFRIEIVAFDWNCSQYITPRYTEPEIRARAAAAG